MFKFASLLADMIVLSADFFVGMAFLRIAHAIIFGRTRKDKKNELSVQTFVAITVTRLLHCSSLYCGTHVEPETLSGLRFRCVNASAVDQGSGAELRLLM